jgi:voltage-gated potassium channel
MVFMAGKMKNIRFRIFQIIEEGEPGDKASVVFDWFITTLIIINVAFVILDTFSGIPQPIKLVSSYVEIYSIIIFTIEYVLRLWTATYKYPGFSTVTAIKKYVFSFMGITDLLAILPFYLPFVFVLDLRILRMLRLFRLLRLFKVTRYSTALSNVIGVFKRKSAQLISSMFVVLILMVIASVVMYGIENAAQPGVFVNAFSGLWWAVATMTTVGYGDIYPITVLGKIVGVFIAILGIGFFAVPTGIISAGFVEEVSNEKEALNEEKHFCPYCGKRIK